MKPLMIALILLIAAQTAAISSDVRCTETSSKVTCRGSNGMEAKIRKMQEPEERIPNYTPPRANDIRFTDTLNSPGGVFGCFLPGNKCK